jgi:hypothetical protein
MGQKRSNFQFIDRDPETRHCSFKKRTGNLFKHAGFGIKIAVKESMKLAKKDKDYEIIT